MDESFRILWVWIALTGVIPKFIKIRIKGKSLIMVIGPRRLPITIWVGEVQDRRIPFMGSVRCTDGPSLNLHQWVYHEEQGT